MFKNDIKKNIQIPYVDLPNRGCKRNNFTCEFKHWATCIRYI